MFACLYLPPLVRPAPEKAQGSGLKAQELIELARDFSPRVETHGDRAVTLDIDGLESLLGDARAIGEALRRTAADRALRVHIAIASTCTAAILLAQSRAGLTVIPAGKEAAALAPLPLSALQGCVPPTPSVPCGPLAPLAPDFALLRRWGLRTLGDLAALPSAELSERLGQSGLFWQRRARGEDARPLVPAGLEEPFEASLDLEWPIDGLEPLSFVLARLFDPLCERLEQRDRGAVALHVTLTLVTKAVHARSLQLPAPMRDARVLRTLALLDLETHPSPAAIDRVRVSVEVTEGRVLQFGLFARAFPAERLATLLARLGALMGSDRVGAPALVDSYRPGVFAMAKFEPSADSKRREQRAKSKGQPPRRSAALPREGGRAERIPNPPSRIPSYVVRRFRSPIPARVTLEQGRPAHVTTDRRGFSGGKVERVEGPWRSSGDWWKQGWDCDEWDVLLNDGASYRISRCIAEREPVNIEREVAARRARASRDHQSWFVNGILD